MDNLRAHTYRGDDLVLNPGATCPNRRDRQHAGRWVHDELRMPHPNMVRTNVRFLCLSCGLTMQVDISCFLPPGIEAVTTGEWGHIGDTGHE